jgi:hypothetical protein
MPEAPKPRNDGGQSRPSSGGGFEKKGGYPGGQPPQKAAPQPKPTAFSTPTKKAPPSSAGTDKQS